LLPEAEDVEVLELVVVLKFVEVLPVDDVLLPTLLVFWVLLPTLLTSR